MGTSERGDAGPGPEGGRRPDVLGHNALGRGAHPLEGLYQELILSHHRNPRYRGTLGAPTAHAHITNPTCGDSVTVGLQLRDGIIEAVRFQGEGCAISLAAASMMASQVEGMPLEEARSLAHRFMMLMRGEDAGQDSEGWDAALGDLRALASVARFPARLRCALLPFEALEAALVSTG